MVIEPFVASVHDIMYWNVIVFQYNPDIPGKKYVPDVSKQKKNPFFLDKKIYEIIRTLN